ncbi:nitrous oxide reductase family maturation protein NosD [Paenibacillus sp. GCM10027626]|uniref:right-handed parallel beta-helix repeat-containing protein n=1 Tax=Paenibacillus sp. GCM10027626 TaxID=3273411 RepID=UPI0036329AED
MRPLFKQAARAMAPSLFVVCLALQFGIYPASAANQTETANLQHLIDAAASGERLVIPTGSYEGAIIIDKPLTIQAERGARLINRTPDAAVTVQADGVQLQGLEIIQEVKGEAAAVLVSAADVRLTELSIKTRAFGILLRDAQRNEIRDSKVVWMDEEGRSPVKMSGKRNGIDLFKSHDNVIAGNQVAGMNDAIYVESSDRNEVTGNQVDSSRYGVHLMYTEGTAVRGNFGSFNITGAMVMGVKGAEVTGNTFFKQSESVNSQGLLLFDVQHSLIKDNKVEGNRVGLYVEQSHNNTFIHNAVLRNFIGIQLLESENNHFKSNDFIANVIEAEAVDSTGNELEANFWDAFKGIDVDGDGRSDTTYAINPFFQQLTSRTPAFQLFFQSPGMLFLENMFAEGRDSWATDRAPLMKPALYKPEGADRHGQAGVLFASAVMLLIAGATIIYYAGGRRR